MTGRFIRFPATKASNISYDLDWDEQSVYRRHKEGYRAGIKFRKYEQSEIPVGNSPLIQAPASWESGSNPKPRLGTVHLKRHFRTNICPLLNPFLPSKVSQVGKLILKVDLIQVLILKSSKSLNKLKLMRPN